MNKIICILITIFLTQACNKDDDRNTNLTALKAGINEINVNHSIDGNLVARSVYIKTPENFNTSSTYPIVFFYHGAGGSGEEFLYNETIARLIDTGNFIGIFPNGYSNDNNGGFWNLGSEPTNADDVEFTNLIMNQLTNFSQINTSKSYAIGYSNGAGMVNLLGKSTNHFNAIAPLFSQQITSTGFITPIKELSVFQVNGENDDLIPLDGGQSPVGIFMSAEESAYNWANHFNCNTDAVQEELNWGDTSVNSFTFLNCNNNNEIKYMIALNTGHGLDNQAEQIIYNEIWSFFKKY